MTNSAEYNENPEITKLFLWVTAVETGVLIIAGGGLLFFPWIMRPLWPWDVAPFNALLLGSIYSASIVATVLTVRVHQHTNTPRNQPMHDLRVVVRDSYYVLRFEAGIDLPPVPSPHPAHFRYSVISVAG